MKKIILVFLISISACAQHTGGGGGVPGSGGGGGSVSSVFGRTGGVTAQTGDYTPTQVGADAAGAAAAVQATLGTAATANTGTSGATVPLLNGINTWSSAQTAPGFFPQNTSAGPYFNYFEDFLYNATVSGGGIGSPTGNSCALSSAFTDNSAPGIMLATSGTGGAATGDYCALNGNTTYLASPQTSGVWLWESRIQISALPGTTASNYQAGMVTSVNSSPWTQGMGFYLSSANGVANDWYCRYSSTQTDSTVAALAATWTRLTIMSDGTNVHWYINGTQVCGTGVALTSMPNTKQFPGWTAVAGTSTSITEAVDYLAFHSAITR